MFVLLILLSLAISFLLTSGLVWLLCWLLPTLGITAIGTFVIVFSRDKMVTPVKTEVSIID